MVDTISPYRSPVRLVLHAAEATSPYSPQAINRARKKMMAEIALGGDEVVLDDVPYSRNDAATLLDNLSEEAWRVHCIIYTYPGLLNFLERQSFDNEELKKADAYRYDPCFIKVVSPFFAHSFNTVSSGFIRSENYEALLLLLNYDSYILPDHQHEAYHRIRHYLDELSYTIRNLSWEKFIADEGILHFVFSAEWQQCMNALPSSFNTLRDEIVDHLIQLVLRFQQKATWYYLHQVLLQLRGLDTNDYNRQEIIRIDEVIYANTKLEGKNGRPKKDDEVSTGRFIWWGVWIVLMIVRAATCNDRSSKTYDFDKLSYEAIRAESTFINESERQNEKLLLHQFDSLLHKKNLAAKPSEIKTGDPAFPFSDDPASARTDSVIVTNNTGMDAVFLYCKDIPGHQFSGKLPKLYSAVIKKGEAQTVYVLPGNGRVYFAFGENWGKLVKPVSLPLPNYVAETGTNQPTGETLPLTAFFRTSKLTVQKYLQHPLYIEYPNTAAPNGKSYHYLNTSLRLNDEQMTRLLLLSDTSGITIKAKGRLTVKEDL